MNKLVKRVIDRQREQANRGIRIGGESRIDLNSQPELERAAVERSLSHNKYLMYHLLCGFIDPKISDEIHGSYLESPCLDALCGAAVKLINKIDDSIESDITRRSD